MAGLTIRTGFARSALTGAGVPFAVRVPAGARVIRVRVLTAPGAAVTAAAVQGRVLYQTLRRVKAAGKAYSMRFRLRSRALYRAVRSGRRYSLEITPGTSTKRLGKATRATFTVR